jgi:pimeloyl-ACP methyl ester carboxylesterase
VTREERALTSPLHTGRAAEVTSLIAALERILALGGVRADSHVLPLPNVRLHWLEAGSGPPLVLLHGASGGGGNWFRVMAPLAAHFRVLAPDLPGFALSGEIPLLPPLGQCVADTLLAWLEALALPPGDIVGTSFGGLVALRIAQRAPARVRRLALLAPAGLGAEVAPLLRLAALPITPRRLLAPGRRATLWTLRSLMTTRWAERGTVLEMVLADYLWRSAAAHDPTLMVRSYRLFCGRGGQRERLSDEELAALSPPTLILWGERDALLPAAHGQRAATLIPRARFHLIPRVGHSLNWEAPATLLDFLLEFLGGETSRA